AEVHVLRVRTDSVQVGALGQVVGVAQAERVLLLESSAGVAVGCIGGVSHVPGSHHLAGAHRGGQTNHVGVNLQATSSLIDTVAARGAGTVSLLIEHTILGLTSSQVQLHDFEVVSQAEVVGLDVLGVDSSVDQSLQTVGVSTNRIVGYRRFHTVVCQCDSQRT